MARSARTPAKGRAYHHGALRDALVAASEAILREKGVEGFTLREAARRAGVSPAAPAHHFGSAAGLLTEVAILGFEALTRYLRDWTAKGGSDPAARLRSQGQGYLRFALDYPARFLLMFRRDRLSAEDPRLKAVGEAAFLELAEAIRAYRGLPTGAPLTPADRTLLMLAWSAVHGVAHLALEGQLDQLAGERPLADFVGDTLAGMLQEALPG